VLLSTDQLSEFLDLALDCELFLLFPFLAGESRCCGYFSLVDDGLYRLMGGIVWSGFRTFGPSSEAV